MLAPDLSIAEFIPLSAHVSPQVVKTTGGDFLLTWRLEGLPFVGREEWELEHRHNTFNRMLQTLRAPDFVNVAFWVHDLRPAASISSSCATCGSRRARNGGPTPACTTQCRWRTGRGG